MKIRAENVFERFSHCQLYERNFC